LLCGFPFFFSPKSTYFVGKNKQREKILLCIFNEFQKRISFFDDFGWVLYMRGEKFSSIHKNTEGGTIWKDSTRKRKKSAETIPAPAEAVKNTRSVAGLICKDPSLQYLRVDFRANFAEYKEEILRNTS